MAACGARDALAQPPAAGSGPGCRPNSQTLCLNAARFRVRVSWRTVDGATGVGTAVALTDESGYFSFFSSSNVELVLKVIDARALDGYFWVFYGALSNVQYTIHVTDTQTGVVKTYVNRQGRLGSVADTAAFYAPLASSLATSQAALAPQLSLDPGVPSPRIAAAPQPDAASSGCAPTRTTLCLNGGRFAVSAVWRDFDGHVGRATAVPLTVDTGYFWFFDAGNVELVLKVLDGRGLNDAFWVFYGALSTVDYVITVRDTETGAARVYRNPAGNLASVADTTALTGRETPADSAAALTSALAPYSQQLTQELANISPGVDGVGFALGSALASLQGCLTTALAGGAACPGVEPGTGTLGQTPVTAPSVQLLSAFLAANGGSSVPGHAAARATRASSSAPSALCPLSPEIDAANSGACVDLGSETAKWFPIQTDFALQAECLAGDSADAALLPVCGAYDYLSLLLHADQALACDFTPTRLTALAISPEEISLGLESSGAFSILGTLDTKAGAAEAAGDLARTAALNFLDRRASVLGVDEQQVDGLASPLAGVALAAMNLAGDSQLAGGLAECTVELPPSLATAALDAPGSDLALSSPRTVRSGASPASGELTPHVVPGTGAWSDAGLTSVTQATVTAAVGTCFYSISPDSESFEASGGSDFVDVTAPAGCPWTAESEDSWISGSGSGDGDGTVSYTVDANDGADPRTGTMTIAGQTFTVSQEGTACTYSISPDGESFGAGGGGDFVDVTAPAGCSWTAESDDFWISVSAAGDGDGTVSFSVDANDTADPRTGTMTIAGQTFVVSQDGIECTYWISSGGADFGADGGSGSVDVSAPEGCPWTAGSDDDWISASGDGSGDGTVSYSVDANDSTDARTGSISIADQTFIVSQDGSSDLASRRPSARPSRGHRPPHSSGTLPHRP